MKGTMHVWFGLSARNWTMVGATRSWTEALKSQVHEQQIKVRLLPLYRAPVQN
jgi:hypothetical protein